MKTPNIHTPPAGRVWFTADHHFGHNGVIRMCGRPFRDAAEMDAALIEAWNSTVRPADTVYFLGDFAMGSSPERCAATFAALRGKLHLVVGNHDKVRVTGLPWESVSERVTVVTDGRRIVCDHYPLRAWVGSFRGALHLHGHTHGSLPGTSQSLDVGVDVWSYRPVGLDDILARMAATPARPEEIERTAGREADDAR
jgi:calcineurin-like phosphoesterase family protein